MRSSLFDWDMLVTVDEVEYLISELGPIIICGQCKQSFFVGNFKQHLIDKHGWKEIQGFQERKK